MKCVKVTVYHDEDNTNKVSAIKLWRTITGLGLKESKDFIDTICPGGYAERKVVVLNMAQYGEMALTSEADKRHAGLFFTDLVRFEKEAINDFSNITQ